MNMKHTNLKKHVYQISKLDIAEEKIRQLENVALETNKIRHREEKE